MSFQAITPLFVAIVPFALAIIGTSFPSMVEDIAGTDGLHVIVISATSFCACIPAINPILAVAFITPYRRMVFGGFTRHFVEKQRLLYRRVVE